MLLGLTEGLRISGLDSVQVGGDLFSGPVPPPQGQEPVDLRLGEASADGFGGHAPYDGVGRHVSCDHRPRANDGAVADGDTGQDHRLIADPHVAAYDDIALVVPRLRDAVCVQPPLLEEDGEDVGGQGALRVVGAVEQELGPAGDGAEFADDKPLMVDGVVVEHIIALKIPGVVDKVVVYGVVPHGDGGVGHHVLQINCAVPLGTGINLPLRNHDKTS